MSRTNTSGYDGRIFDHDRLQEKMEVTCPAGLRYVTNRSSGHFGFCFHLLSDESSGGSDNHKWNGPPRNRRTRPLPLPSSSVDAGAVDMGDLEHLVGDLMKHPESWPFRKPVTKSEAHKILLSFTANEQRYKTIYLLSYF